MLINLVTYNIHEGRTAFLRHRSIERILAALDRMQADIVCMQEVMHYSLGQSHTSSQFALNGWPHSVFGMNSQLRKGCKGNATLSRLPILEWCNTDVSIRHAESRGLLLTRLETDAPNNQLTVVNLHFGLRPKERMLQVRQLIEVVQNNTDPAMPLVIAGDFNDWRQKMYPILERELQVHNAYIGHYGRHTATFPAMLPSLALDHIYLRNCELVTVEIEPAAFRWGHSDHLPVKAVFRI